MTERALEPEMETPGTPKRRLPIVWLFPLLAVGVALFLLWREYSGRGPVIEIVFSSASGVVAGETMVRYRDLDVGQVEALRFSDNLSSVIASVRLSPEVAKFVDDGAEFWLVRPEVSSRGISGLETVISGVYIKGAWDAVAGGAKTRFEALATAPLTAQDAPGKRVRLRSSEGGSLSVGAPVLYRGVEVGKIETRRLTDDGTAVEFDIFVNAPNDQRLTEEARFWNVSGVDLSLGAEGARLRVASLVSLLQGGVAFDDLSNGSAPLAEDGQAFALYATEQDARARALEVDPGRQLLLDIFFAGSVRGLNIGAAVEYQGIPIGRVVDISAEIDPARGLFSTRTTIAISPARLGLEESDVDATLDYLKDATRKGLRAQLTSGNLFTGALIVRFVSEPGLPGDPGVEIVEVEGQNPLMPAIRSDLDELAGSVEGVLRRVDALPVEELFANAVRLLENINLVIGTDAARQAPASAVATLAAFEELLKSDGLRKAPQEAAALIAALRETVEAEEIKAARADIAALLASAASIAKALDEGGVASEAAGALTALRARLDDPALAAAPENLNAALTAAATFLASPALTETPAEMNAALAALRTALAAPGLTDAPEELNAVLRTARGLLEDFANAGTATEAAAAAAALRARLEDPALAALASSMRQSLDAATAVLAAPGAEEMPEALNQALAALRRTLDAPGLAEAPAELTGMLASARSLLETLERENVAGEIAAAAGATRRLVDDPALRTLATNAAAAADSLRAALQSEGAEDLPAAASRALDATAALFAQLERENLAGTTADTLKRVGRATDAATTALAQAPAMMARLSAAAAQAEAMLASLDVGSELNYEAVTAIREIRDAARAITDLTALLERRPNSLILGR